jgi:hypothetical protein
VTGRGILHPCPVCQDPKRACGHTSADVRRFYQQTHEIKEIAKKITDAPRTHHKVPKSGSNVFPAQDGEGYMLFRGSDGKLIRARTSEVPPIRSLSPDEYAGCRACGEANAGICPTAVHTCRKGKP